MFRAKSLLHSGMDQLVRFGKWRYLNMEKSAVEKKFEFASTAIATRFEAQARDALAALQPSERVSSDISTHATSVTIRIPNRAESNPDPAVVAWAASKTDELAAELRLAGGWR